MQEGQPWGAPPAWCLGRPGTPRGCSNNLLLWQVVTETTCPGLSSHKSTVQTLKICRDYLPVSQRLLFNVCWICILPWSGHKYPKQWVTFNLSWEIIPHSSLSWSISSHSATLLALWPAFIYLLCTDPNSLTSHCFCSTSPSRGRFIRRAHGRLPSTSQAVHISSGHSLFHMMGPGSFSSVTSAATSCPAVSYTCCLVTNHHIVIFLVAPPRAGIRGCCSCSWQTGRDASLGHDDVFPLHKMLKH